MKNLWWGLLFWLWLATPVYAQNIVNETDEPLNETAIQEVVDSLEKEGARVAVYVVAAGSETDFAARLQADGHLKADGTPQNNLLALYISQNPSLSYIRWGGKWSADLGDSAENIRQETTNPYIQDGLYTQAVTRTLEALEKEINPATWQTLTWEEWVKVALSVGLVILLGLALGWFKVFLGSPRVNQP